MRLTIIIDELNAVDGEATHRVQVVREHDGRVAKFHGTFTSEGESLTPLMSVLEEAVAEFRRDDEAQQAQSPSLADNETEPELGEPHPDDNGGITLPGDDNGGLYLS